MSYDRLAEKYGPHASTIRVRAKKYGWARLVPTASLTPGRKPPSTGTKKRGQPPVAEVRRRRFLRRMFQVLDAGIREMEERMAERAQDGASQTTAADAERDARSLAQYMQLYARLAELDEQARGLGKTGSDSMKGAMDADELRRDLALRLEKLNQARDD